MTDHALVVEAARRRFTGGGSVAVDALDGLDLSVAAGSIVAVLGPSGCGKTTLLRAVAGTERLDGGRITIGERIAVDVGVGRGRSSWVPPERRNVGLVPQDGALFPHLDVTGNIAFGIHALPRAERRARVEDLLELVELAGYGTRRPHELSGGERRRVALARALAPSPDVVLLDEPFSALDAGLRSSLRDEVADLLRRSATTAVIVTHDRTEAMAMADEVAVMRAGRIVQRGRPDELYRSPVDAWTASFLGDVVVLPATMCDGLAVCELGRLVVAGDVDGAPRPADGTAVTVLLRPEQVVRVELEQSGAVRAVVAAVRFLGPDVAAELRVGDRDDGAGTLVTVRWPSSAGEPAVGEQIGVLVTGAARAFPAAEAGASAVSRRPGPDAPTARSGGGHGRRPAP